MLRTMLAGLLAACCAVGASGAQTYHPAFDPTALKGPRFGAPNALMILRSPHLSGLPESFDPAPPRPLLDRLEASRPPATATDTLSGPPCESLRHYPARYGTQMKRTDRRQVGQ